MSKSFASQTRNIKKSAYLLICLLTCCILMAPVFGRISPVQFSDGIPMLGRVYSFESGEISIGEYLFTAHGNSMHVGVYFAAILDDMLFSGSQSLLIGFLYAGMLGTGMLLALALYNEQNTLVSSVLTVIIVNAIVIGTYNIDLYLSFQMVLTFSRFIFLLLLYAMSGNLMKKKCFNTSWLLLLFCSCLAAPLHGMGVMFALAIFYIHIVTKQKWFKSVAGAAPFIFYIVLQLHYNTGFGEVTTAKGFALAHLGILVKCTMGFFGGLFYQLFGLSEQLSAILGSVVWAFVAAALLFFFIRGIMPTGKIGWFEHISIEMNATALFFLSATGAAFLASIASASFVVARMDLVESFASNPLGTTLGTGRYLCFGVMPYISIFYIAGKKIAGLRKNGQYALAMGLGITALLTLFFDYDVTKLKTIEFFKLLDQNGAALISGVSLRSGECELVYGNFSSDWYWKDRTITVYDNLRSAEKYLWKNHPAVGSRVEHWEAEDYLNIKRVDYYESSDEKYYCVQLVTETPPDGRYCAIVDEGNHIIGYASTQESPGFYRLMESDRLYYDENYYLRGYVLRNYR